MERAAVINNGPIIHGSGVFKETQIRAAINATTIVRKIRNIEIINGL
jgi:hypothetical protein